MLYVSVSFCWHCFLYDIVLLQDLEAAQTTTGKKSLRRWRLRASSSRRQRHPIGQIPSRKRPREVVPRPGPVQTPCQPPASMWPKSSPTPRPSPATWCLATVRRIVVTAPTSPSSKARLPSHRLNISGGKKRRLKVTIYHHLFFSVIHIKQRGWLTP